VTLGELSRGRGGRGRGEGRGRGRGRGEYRGRGGRGRGGFGGQQDGDQFIDEKRENRREVNKDYQDKRWDGKVAHGRQFDKQSGSGWRGHHYGNKDGHGRGGWGNENVEKRVSENRPVDEAVDGVEKATTAEEEKEATTPVEEVPQKPVEEEVNNKTYAELKAEREQKKLRKDARAAETFKEDGKIEKKDRKGDGYKTIDTKLTGIDNYAVNQLDAVLGFNAGAAATKDEELRESAPF